MKTGILPLFGRGFIDNGPWFKAFCQAAERAGAESLWTVEHPIVAENYDPLYSYSEDGKAPFTLETVMPDPLVPLAFAASVTERIKLGTGVILLPLHSPIIVAKRVATLDALSGGRVLLGSGLGWQKEEFAAVNVPYEERGPRTDEVIEAMRALWSQSPASYQGKHYAFERVHSDPKPANGSSVPIIIGGSTDLAAKRAARLGDGFYPHAISPEDFARRVETMNRAARELGRNPAEIELTVSPTSWKFGSGFDLGVVRAYAALGVTRFIIGAFEAEGTDAASIERLIRRHQDEIIARL